MVFSKGWRLEMQELEALARQVSNCFDCPLGRNRTRAVPGEGPGDAEVMFIGEAPGFHEDQQGRPFVGPAGKLLEELLASVGLRRDQVYITNMVKCRPPNNRDPLPSEMEACRKYLDRQIQLIRPRVIVTLGRHSLGKFFPRETISRAHGRPRVWNGIVILPMYHPAAALHYQGLRRALEEDFRALPQALEQARRLEAPPSPSDSSPQQLSMF